MRRWRLGTRTVLRVQLIDGKQLLTPRPFVAPSVTQPPPARIDVTQWALLDSNQ